MQKAPENETPDASGIVKEEPVVFGKQFFDYDQIDYYSIDYYSIDYPDEGDMALYNDRKKSKIDSLRFEAISEYSPRDVSNKAFVDGLTEVGFKKTSLMPEKFISIDSLFVEKKVNDGMTACSPMYRDILVFKKENKTIGIAKICFRCDSFFIIGTDANTENFGQNGDYYKFKKLLNRE